jgi:hypothetical protein
MAEHLRRFASEEGVVFIGKAQENTPVFRTERRNRRPRRCAGWFANTRKQSPTYVGSLSTAGYGRKSRRQAERQSAAQPSPPTALRPAAVILTRTTSIALPPAFITSCFAAASPRRTSPASMRRLGPWPSTSSSSAQRCSTFTRGTVKPRANVPQRTARGVASEPVKATKR